MKEDAPRLAVHRFVHAARERAGNGPKLVEVITPLLGRTVEPETVNNWAQGARLPSADVLVAILRAFPDLSFDAYARGEEAGSPDHQRRIVALEAAVHRLMEIVAERLEVDIDVPGVIPRG